MGRLELGSAGLGSGLVTAGVAVIYWPLGLITFGLLLIVFAVVSTP